MSKEERRLLERYWAPFGRGPRQCAGMALAIAELQFVVGNLFAVFGNDLELFETQDKDIMTVIDMFLPFQELSSLGLRVLVR